MDIEASKARTMFEKYCISLFLMESGELALNRSISLCIPILIFWVIIRIIPLKSNIKENLCDFKN
jgi:hypothetical protein